MQTNWNIILNVLLLLGIIISIRRLVKARSQRLNPIDYQPQNEPFRERDRPSLGDDIIAVRRVNSIDENDPLPLNKPELSLVKESEEKKRIQEIGSTPDELEMKPELSPSAKQEDPVLMLFLLAKENRHLAGYELLQSLLAAGLSFGEGSLFHRHQNSDGQGPILCSLAAATPSGTFDFQNIGGFSVKGLCLFMSISSNSTINKSRFTVLYQIATQLRDGLDVLLLDDRKQRLTQSSFNRYAMMLNNPEIRDLYMRSPYFNVL